MYMVCLSDNQPNRWTVANIAHLSFIPLGGRPTCDVRRGRFSKQRLITLRPGGIICHLKCRPNPVLQSSAQTAAVWWECHFHGPFVWCHVTHYQHTTPSGCTAIHFFELWGWPLLWKCQNATMLTRDPIFSSLVGHLHIQERQLNEKWQCLQRLCKELFFFAKNNK